MCAKPTLSLQYLFFYQCNIFIVFCLNINTFVRIICMLEINLYLCAAFVKKSKPTKSECSD